MCAGEVSPGPGPFLAGLRDSLKRGLSPARGLLPAHCHVIYEFLPASALEHLTRYVAEREHAFTASAVMDASGRVEFSGVHRRSRVLFDLGDIRPMFLRRLQSVLPAVLAKIQIAPFPISAVDTQVTATNDAEFFRPHRDNGTGVVARRTISYTYFFHSEPARFTGGDLCLYSQSQNSDPGRGPATRIAPRRNMIVFFPSGIQHEITAVSCPTRRFSDSRFNINGWIYR